MEEQIRVGRLGTLLINWLSAALTDRTPMELPEEMDFEELYSFSVFHGVANLVFYSITKLQKKPDPGLYAKWQRQCLTNAAKTENQRRERNRIIETLTGAGIDLLPMKGCRLIELYPSPDYRMMSDLDMLIDPAKAKQVRKLMTGMGYQVETFGDYHHDSYLLPPYVSVEIHRHIGDETGKDSLDLERAIHGYTEGIWKRVLPVEGHPHLYRLDDTEYYIQMILHFAKHALINGGSGIRSIMDFHIYLSACKNNLDRDRINTIMTQLGLTDFLRLTETLTDLWFGDTDADSVWRTIAQDGELAEFVHAVLVSGLYGTGARKAEMRIAHEMENGLNRNEATRKFFLFRVFPPLRVMRARYGILRKLPILLPFCWIVRLIYALLFRRNVIRTNMNVIRENKNKQE